LTEQTANEKMKQLVSQMTELDIQSWLAFDVFSGEWWLQLVMFSIPWLIFFKLADRRRLPELLLLGTWALIVAETLDHIGFELGLWYYPVELLPLFPRFEEVNLATLPVTYMLIYQYYPQWGRYLTALTVMSALFVGLAEPALVRLGLYEPITWEFYYGFPIYILIGLALKYLVQKTYSIAQKHSRI
jgi:hypothetical protein